MRRLIAELRPSTLDELGLGAALEALGERIAADGSVEVEVELDLAAEAGRHDARLLGEIEDAVYRLVQEGLHNAAQHSEAARVTVELAEAGGVLRVRIEGDGSGFDPGAPTEGFGLLGMRERAELVGGKLDLLSMPGDGTTIVAVIPAVHRKRS